MKFVNDDEDDTGLKPVAIKQACKDNGGQWKDNDWCKFDKDKTGNEKEFEHQLEDRGLMYYYDDKESGSDEWEKYQQEKQEKEICKNYNGEWLINANECKFDDNGDQDSVDFDHTMEEKGLWDDYVADKRPYNPNDVDSDNDGIYDDEELSEEEEKALAKSKGADEMTDKEKKKLDEENQKVVDEWVKDELKATEDELRAMTASKPNYDK